MGKTYGVDLRPMRRALLHNAVGLSAIRRSRLLHHHVGMTGRRSLIKGHLPSLGLGRGGRGGDDRG